MAAVPEQMKESIERKPRYTGTARLERIGALFHHSQVHDGFHDAQYC